MKMGGATVILFPMARHASVRVVADKLAALPPSERGKAWKDYGRRLIRSRRASGASPEAVAADAVAFRQAVRVLVAYLEAHPSRSEDRA